MNDAKALWDHLTNNPQDSTAKLALADLCIEQGNEDLGFALKWCVKWKCWPSQGPKGQPGGKWSWMAGTGDKIKLGKWADCIIPRLVYQALTHKTDHYAYRRNCSGTLQTAMGKLAKSLKRLRTLTEVE